LYFVYKTACWDCNDHLGRSRKQFVYSFVYCIQNLKTRTRLPVAERCTERLTQHHLRARAMLCGSNFWKVLAGNLHTQNITGTPWEPGFKPMGWHLLHLGKSIVSLNNTYDSGTAWLSLVPGICGVQDVKGQFRGGTPLMQILHSRSYHGSFYVGAVTASPLAKQCKH
jgi:hypothetical protein